MWAYVLILIIGVAVTVAGVRLGRRRREDPFADVRSSDDDASATQTSEPAPFTSLREPTPLGAVDDETTASSTTVAGPRVPRATLEERLLAARDARATQRDEPGTDEATAEAARPAEPSASPTREGEPTTADGVERSPAAVEPTTPPPDEIAAADPGSVVGTTPAAEPEDTGSDRAAGADAPAPAPAEPVLEPIVRRPLTSDVREDFAQRWTPIRMRLLARPSAAIGDADVFARELLEAQGLPNDPDDPAMAEASNTYPDVIDPFRLATAIARKAEDGTAEPEQLRLATVHYRDAVERLLAADDLPVA